MGKIIAFDFGVKRTGIAETDELQIIASGLATVPTKEIWDFIEKYIKENTIDEMVVGDPGPDTNNTEPSSEFYSKLIKKYPTIPVHRHDESFTSVMARQAMIEGGIGKKKRRNKSLIDKISAVFILRSYLEQKQKF